MNAVQGLGRGQDRPYRRILAVKLADLGDLLSITPALQALRAAHPQARIDLLAQPSSAQILDGAPYIDNLIPFDGFAFINSRSPLHPARLANIARTLMGLRLVRYDAFAIFHHSTNRWGTLNRAILCMAVGAKTTVGLDNGLSHARFFVSRLTHRVPDRGFGALHEAGYWLEVAGELGANKHAGWQLHIPVNDEHRAFVSDLLDQGGLREQGPLVAIHPGAGAWSKARIWPARRFAGVARRLMDEQEARIVVVGGPDEVESANELVQLLYAGTPGQESRILNLAGCTNIHQSAALIERCDLFVGGDSGPMHVAVAVGTPVVAVFGPSNKEAWGPYTPPGESSPHTVVTRNLPCQPCFYRGLTLGLREGCGTRPCLLGLGIEPVVEACAARLSVSQ